MFNNLAFFWLKALGKRKKTENSFLEANDPINIMYNYNNRYKKIMEDDVVLKRYKIK